MTYNASKFAFISTALRCLNHENSQTTEHSVNGGYKNTEKKSSTNHFSENNVSVNSQHTNPNLSSSFVYLTFLCEFFFDKLSHDDNIFVVQVMREIYIYILILNL